VHHALELKVVVLALVLAACARPRGMRPDTGVDAYMQDDASAMPRDAFVTTDAFVPGRDAAPMDAFTSPDASAPADAFVPRDTGPACTPLASMALPGTITAGPTFHRPTADCGAPSTGTATAVFYDVHVFCNPGIARSFDFQLTRAASGGITDPFIVIERGTGDVSTLVCVASDDDGAGLPNSLATAMIPSGATISVVATTYDNDDTGDYTLTITAR
jgi:hypothetical protein